MKMVQIFWLACSAIALTAAGVAVGYRLHSEVGPGQPAPANAPVVSQQSAAERTPLYYQDPDGKSDYSPMPKKTADGRDYKAVYADAGAQDTAAKPQPAAKGKILYYRNPMGLPDTSPVPKKDSMGMDYIPVHEGEDESGVVTVSPARMQMLGVRTVTAQISTTISHSVQAAGTVQPAENSIAVVNTKFDGFIEKLFVATTGQSVRVGQPLAQVWVQTPDITTRMGPDIVTREVDYIVAMQQHDDASMARALQNLRNYGIPDSAIAEIRRTGRATRSITVSAPFGGTITEKPAIEGMRFNTGDPLFKIADLSRVWVIADVPEQDLGAIRKGQSARVTFVAFPGRSFTGMVDFIYPTLTANTRTGQVRIVLSNKDGLLRQSMYASVLIDAAVAQTGSVLVVPDSAIIDSGSAQVVLIAKDQGQFEPRPVHIGARGDGTTQILSGLKPGEQVVVGANFLIDAESNLRAALKAFTSDKDKSAPGDKP